MRMTRILGWTLLSILTGGLIWVALFTLRL
jgi:hypothetical protein